MIRVLLVDDHELVRTGVRRILEDAGGIRVVGEAASGEEGLALVRKDPPDVVLLDVHMPGIGGLETARRMLQACPDLRIIALTAVGNQPIPAQLLRLGVAGYLTKGCPATEMLSAIRSVFAGQRHIAADVAREIALSSVPARSGGNGEASPFDGVSPREMQVLLMVAQGRTIQDISDTLNLSPKTVSTYRYRLFEKLSVQNDVELTRLAVRHGLIAVDATN